MDRPGSSPTLTAASARPLTSEELAHCESTEEEEREHIALWRVREVARMEAVDACRGDPAEE